MPKNQPTAHFAVKRILDCLGTPRQLAERCAARGLRAPNESTVRMWRHRNRLPTAWIPTLLLTMPPDTNLTFFIMKDAPPADPFA